MNSDASRPSVAPGSLLKRAATSLLLLVVCLCSSCGGPRRTQYYTLRTPAPPPASDPKTNFVLQIDRFHEPQTLRDDRIIFYRSPTELNFYEHHRWSADPGTMLAEAAAHWLQQAAIFAVVGLAPSQEHPDYLLAGHVLSFEEVDYEGGVKGRVGLALALVRARDHKAVWSARRQVENSAQGEGVTAVVDALDRASQELFEDLMPGLVSQVENDFKKESEVRSQKSE